MTAALLAGAIVLPAIAQAQSQPPAYGSGSAASRAAPALPVASDISAQRRRTMSRLRVYPNREDVYPRYYPGPNAVRVCNATYVQEHRPSGTVIVPRMSCYWRG